MIDVPINKEVLPFPDFKYNDIMNPDEFDQNNASLKGKIDEVIDVVNDNTDKLTSQIAIVTSLISRVDIVEQGVNSNGDFIRFNNGLQICWKPYEILANITWNTSVFNGLTYYYSHQKTWNYPKPFKTGSMPIVLVSGDLSPTVGVETHNVLSGTTESLAHFEHGVIGNVAPTEIRRRLFALGWWK